MRLRAWSVVFMCVFVSVSLPVFADQITYTFSAVGSGTVGTTAFINDLVTLTSVGDASGIYPISYTGISGFWNNSITATIDIAGVGSGELTEPTRVFVNQTNGTVGFNSSSYGDLLDASNDPDFGTYGLVSSFGPVTVSGDLVVGQFTNVSTSLGLVTITATQSTATFQAVTAVPESGTLSLLVLGFGMLAVILRQRHQGRESGSPSPSKGF